MKVDPKTHKRMNKPAPARSDTTFKNWDGLVEKRDGSVGKWGEPLNIGGKEPEVRLSPKGTVPRAKIDSLKNLNDPSINRILNRKVNGVYGPDDSDVIKKLAGVKKK